MKRGYWSDFTEKLTGAKMRCSPPASAVSVYSYTLAPFCCSIIFFCLFFCPLVKIKIKL